jgi:hypothetical protein
VLGAFNTVYTALKGFFSRGFWFSTFLPVALFSALHCLIALVKYGSLSLFGMNLSLNSAPSAVEFAQAAPLIMVALVVISFALAPFVDYLRGPLDGSLLRKALHDWLRKRRYTIARAKEQELKALFEDLGAVSDVNDRYSADNGRNRARPQDGDKRGCRHRGPWRLGGARQRLGGREASRAVDDRCGGRCCCSFAAERARHQRRRPARRDKVLKSDR